MSTSNGASDGDYLNFLAEFLREQSKTAAEVLRLGPAEVAWGVRAESVAQSWPGFPKAARYTTRSRPPSPFAHTVRIVIQEAARKGETWLLTAWLRCAGGASGQVVHMVEEAEEPYQNLLYHPVSTGPGWTQVWLPFEVNEDWPAGSLRYQLLLQERPQSLELGGLALFRLGPNPYRHLLPDSRSQAGSPLVVLGAPDAYHLGLVGLDETVRWMLPPDLRRALEGLRPWGQVRLRTQEVGGQPFSQCILVNAEADGGVELDLQGQGAGGDWLHLRVHLRSESENPVRIELLDEDQTACTVYRDCLARCPWSAFPFQIPLIRSSGRLRLRLQGAAGGFYLGPLACWVGPKRAEPVRGRREDGWKEAALERIERSRKTELVLEVTDCNGRALPDCLVNLRQINHRFLFGTAVRESHLRSHDPTHERYRRELLGLGLNSATPENELSWPCWHGRGPAQRVETLQSIGWLKQHGFRLRGHFLIPGAWENGPAGLSEQPDLEACIRERIESVLSRPELVQDFLEWDLFNEPVSLPQLLAKVGREAIPGWFEQARRLAPGCRFVVNEQRLLSEAGYHQRILNSTRELMEGLAQSSVSPIGLGLQCHLRGILPTPSEVFRTLNALSGPGWDLRVTELDASDGCAAEFRDFLVALFSVPDLTGITLWGFWDGAHWHDDALIYDRYWGLKPKGEAFLQLMREEWNSSCQLKTDSQGQIRTRLFQGDYELQAIESRLWLKVVGANQAATFRLAG